MTLAMVLRAKQEGLPLPGAIAPATPWSDMTKTGDTYFANEMVDNILVSNDGWLADAANLYANGHDIKDPMLSPVYGEFPGFPRRYLLRARAICFSATQCGCIESCGRRALWPT